jgi:hypothetical protein
MGPSTDDDPRDYECPLCGAEPNKPCVTYVVRPSVPMLGYHREREEVAARFKKQ